MGFAGSEKRCGLGALDSTGGDARRSISWARNHWEDERS